MAYTDPQVQNTVPTMTNPSRANRMYRVARPYPATWGSVDVAADIFTKRGRGGDRSERGKTLK
jgi:hypothetical protein